MEATNTQRAALDVVLVDQNDREIGRMEKLAAHTSGALHRAISVIITRQHPQHGTQVLLQQRQFTKYHCGGLWSNACCSHPLPNETPMACAKRRLQQELDINCELTYKGSFIYHATLEHGMSEHELDHVYIGAFNHQLPPANPDEVAAVRWIRLQKLQQQLEEQPILFTPWLKLVLQQAKLLT